MRDRETLSLYFRYGEREMMAPTSQSLQALDQGEGSGLISEPHGRKPKNDPAVFALNRIENDLKIGSSPSYTVIAASF